MIKKFLNIVLPIFFLVSCNGFITSDTEKYFNETFNLIKENSVKKNEIDWAELKKTVRDSIKNFNSNHDVHLGIAYTMVLINDGHSIFGVPQSDNTKAINSKKSNNHKNIIPPIVTKILGNDIAYIKLSGLSIISDSLSKNYTMEIRKALLALDNSASLSGWIIDLRENGGGRLSCESLGLAPLFENSLIGLSWSNKNIYSNVICTNEYFKFGENIQDSLFYDSTLVNKHKKIAILIDKKTVSSGEFLALAFKFQDNTKTFGKQTRGKTSHCLLYNLKDGAILLLATAYYCDKNKTVIRNGIVPDIECDSEESLTKAIDWIKNDI
ncbi:MAG: Peptidase family S41 [Bacteroidetes bacterium ADurb.Bin174]|nr:MAG: Peptidase family S41 [Bacteroidetes bacterium ADurb.Bin174]